MAVFWLLAGDEKVPSSRIHGINIHNFLKEKGYRSFVLYKPPLFVKDILLNRVAIKLLAKAINATDIVIIQKLFGKNTEYFVDILRKRGVSFIFIDCDLPLKLNIAKLAKKVICPSSLLCELYQKKGIENVILINDAVEQFKVPSLKKVSEDKFRAVWFGTFDAARWNSVKWFNEKVIPEMDGKWELTTISNIPEADIQWSRDSFNIINKADIIVVPLLGIQNDNNYLVKSANRITQSMALGVPVLCTGIPSYRDIIVNGENGFICEEKKEDWVQALLSITSVDKINLLKKNAYEAARSYSLEQIGEVWKDVLTEERLIHKNNKPLFFFFLFKGKVLLSRIKRTLK